MAIAGTICLGLVWGWLLVRRLQGARWPAALQMLAGLAAQAALVIVLLNPIGLVWFGLGVASGAFVAGMVVRSWRRAA